MSVDDTLIDEMLRLTPVERLRQNDRAATTATKLREAFERTMKLEPTEEQMAALIHMIVDIRTWEVSPRDAALNAWLTIAPMVLEAAAKRVEEMNGEDDWYIAGQIRAMKP